MRHRSSPILGSAKKRAEVACAIDGSELPSEPVSFQTIMVTMTILEAPDEDIQFDLNNSRLS